MHIWTLYAASNFKGSSFKSAHICTLQILPALSKLAVGLPICNKWNTILRYSQWIHFVIWFQSMCFESLSILSYSLVFAEWNCERQEALRMSYKIHLYLKNVVKLCSVLHWLQASMQPWSKNRHMSIVKSATLKVIKCGLLKE